MRKDSKLISHLKDLYKNIGNEWVDKNSLVINLARRFDLIVGGSFALGVGSKNPFKVPGDIDLFTNDQSKAFEFVANLMAYLDNRPNTHYSLKVNNETEFVLETVKCHYKFQTPLFKSVCIMALYDKINFYRIPGGLMIQNYDDVVGHALAASKRDGKPRLPSTIDLMEEFNMGGTSIRMTNVDGTNARMTSRPRNILERNDFQLQQAATHRTIYQS